MFIKIEGIEPQFKIYKMSENIEGKVYIGKTKRPLQERINGHRSPKQYADKHFSNVGWNNVLVEIIDTANDDEELSKKEYIKINECYTDKKHLLLNKNNFYDYSQYARKESTIEVPTYIQYSEIDLFPNDRLSGCQRKIDDYSHDVFKFIKNNKYIIKQVFGAREYVSNCILKMKNNELTNANTRTMIINYLRDKPWRGKCEMNSQWNKSFRF